MFKNLRLTIYKAIILLLVATYFCLRYYQNALEILETLLGISVGFVLIAEFLKMREDGKAEQRE